MTDTLANLAQRIEEIYQICVARGNEPLQDCRFFNLPQGPITFKILELKVYTEDIRALLSVVPADYKLGAPLQVLAEAIQDALNATDTPVTATTEIAYQQALRLMQLGIATGFVRQTLPATDKWTLEQPNFPYYIVSTQDPPCLCGLHLVKTIGVRMVCDLYPGCRATKPT